MTARMSITPRVPRSFVWGFSLRHAFGLRSAVAVRALSVLAILATLAWPQSLGAPPFSGTIFIDPDIVQAGDATAYAGLQEAGRGVRRMFDRRVNGWVDLQAFLFHVWFDDGLRLEAQVNPEFGTVAAARSELLLYLHAIGQLPAALRQDVRTVWLHQGLFPFGGGNSNLLIHAGQGREYIASGILEETFIHEAAHTSLDQAHAASPGWLAAQRQDPEFISNYARDNPAREDIAESYLPYFAVRHRPVRISPEMRETIVRTMPNRIAYFDAQILDLHPAVPGRPLALHWPDYDPLLGRVRLVWDSRPGRTYAIELSEDFTRWSPHGPVVRSQGDETAVEIEERDLEFPVFFRIRVVR